MEHTPDNNSVENKEDKNNLLKEKDNLESQNNNVENKKKKAKGEILTSIAFFLFSLAGLIFYYLTDTDYTIVNIVTYIIIGVLIIVSIILFLVWLLNSKYHENN